VERFSEVSGTPVICADTGEKAGVVESVVCNERDMVLGFLVNAGKITGKYAFLPIEDVAGGGESAVTVIDRNCIVRKRKDVRAHRKNGNWIWLDKKVRTDEGHLLGVVKDGFFDIDSGKISGIELSLGVIEDLRDGRRRLAIDEDTEFGQEFIVLKNGGKHDG